MNGNLSQQDKDWAIDEISQSIQLPRDSSSLILDRFLSITDKQELEAEMLEVLGYHENVLEFASKFLAKAFPPFARTSSNAVANETKNANTNHTSLTKDKVNKYKESSVSKTHDLKSTVGTHNVLRKTNITKGVSESKNSSPTSGSVNSNIKQSVVKESNKGTPKGTKNKQLQQKSAANKRRIECGCQGVYHELFTNCITCGRAVCQAEGPGKCFFCKTEIQSPQQQILETIKKILGQHNGNNEDNGKEDQEQSKNPTQTQSSKRNIHQLDKVAMPIYDLLMDRLTPDTTGVTLNKSSLKNSGEKAQSSSIYTGVPTTGVNPAAILYSSRSITRNLYKNSVNDGLSSENWEPLSSKTQNEAIVMKGKGKERGNGIEGGSQYSDKNADNGDLEWNPERLESAFEDKLSIENVNKQKPTIANKARQLMQQQSGGITIDESIISDILSLYEALALKERLLLYDRTSAQRSKLIDLDKDFDLNKYLGSNWLTESQKMAYKRAFDEYKQKLDEYNEKQRKGVRVLSLDVSNKKGAVSYKAEKAPKLVLPEPQFLAGSNKSNSLRRGADPNTTDNGLGSFSDSRYPQPQLSFVIPKNLKRSSVSTSPADHYYSYDEYACSSTVNIGPAKVAREKAELVRKQDEDVVEYFRSLYIA
ncbi:hypothetical protein AX774_g1058 [Zancudomyces culisetae]|uniref:TRIP4/RQT4 C2HC5-type zinc finger domain-containing protein n=1 Tax=Zancudomyces culisetae TaxID=1213189 RepID=A0A1R1PF20_ZANCU|nr:hypothetical protein AX774_g7021 [Zancudomyces culisetae]OMH85406.1 hypothetical protein AX774_g1058 [Zancudomyces culisetae]|eukprot:OMH79561.1 hypothetical protein AX774_g7021 [Zancudomyces culisetae]